MVPQNVNKTDCKITFTIFHCLSQLQNYGKDRLLTTEMLLEMWFRSWFVHVELLMDQT